ncbi:MAG: hypothetical protein V4732_10630 [Pseudomonadota bacterium]
MMCNTYKLTFFPLHNAFSISPAPPHRTDKEGPTLGEPEIFQWLFENEDILEFYWDGHDDNDYIHNVTDVYLQFFRHGITKPNERRLPFSVHTNNGWKPADGISQPADKASGIYRITANNKIQINKIHDNARWSFDFCCTVNNHNYTIDPEMRIGKR